MLGNISIVQLLIVLVIIMLLFGTKKLRNIGSDLGGAVKGFKDAMRDGEDEQQKRLSEQKNAQDTTAQNSTVQNSTETRQKDSEQS